MRTSKLVKAKEKSSEQAQEKMSRTVRKLIESKTLDKAAVAEFYAQIKMLEFNDIKTLEATRQLLSLINGKVKERLNDTKLSNKQKAEIMLIAQLEVYAAVDALVSSIENLHHYN